MKNNCRLTVFVVALLLTARSYANCNAIDLAIQNAPNQFSSLKGSRDPDGDGSSYKTSWVFGDFRECSLEHSDDHGFSLYCSSRASSFDDAKAQAERIASDVEGCLRKHGQVKLGDWRDSNINLASASTKSLSKTFLAPTPSNAYDVEVYVSSSCTLSKSRGTERCRTSLSIELRGDEK